MSAEAPQGNAEFEGTREIPELLTVLQTKVDELYTLSGMSSIHGKQMCEPCLVNDERTASISGRRTDAHDYEPTHYTFSFTEKKADRVNDGQGFKAFWNENDPGSLNVLYVDSRRIIQMSVSMMLDPKKALEYLTYHAESPDFAIS